MICANKKNNDNKIIKALNFVEPTELHILHHIIYGIIALIFTHVTCTI